MTTTLNIARQKLVPTERMFHVKNAEERFWNKVQKGNTSVCWLWIAGRSGHRYGKLRWDNRIVAAHRVSYLIHYGPIPSGKYICHHCDNPICVNPYHLYLGSALENNRDTLRRQRRPQHYTKMADKINVPQ
jgi:HNH endonuclease